MRKLNKVELINSDLVALGPGSTWGRVKSYLPYENYTYIHGQCLSVGVGGYLLGGGINVMGATQKFGSTGSKQVLQFTMVDAEGRILTVSLIKFVEYLVFSKRLNM